MSLTSGIRLYKRSSAVFATATTYYIQGKVCFVTLGYSIAAEKMASAIAAEELAAAKAAQEMAAAKAS